MSALPGPAQEESEVTGHLIPEQAIRSWHCPLAWRGGRIYIAGGLISLSSDQPTNAQSLRDHCQATAVPSVAGSRMHM